MVLQVGKINNVHFRSANQQTLPINENNSEIKITELQKVTPDFGVQIPQKYTKTDVIILENGLKLYSYKLANGHKVTIIPMENSPAMVKNYVNVGSMNETDDIKGISHFLEHMAFNGTNGTEGYIKLNRGDSFKKVDEMGGWTNASTNYALTDYVNSTPLLDDNDLEKQIQIIASMTEDLKLSEDMVEKEKFPVCSEIDMILDSPETIAIDQTVRSLFNIRSSSDELVGGSVNHIQNLNRQKVLEYYNKYYTPDNMHLVITGNVNPEKTMQIVAKNFHSTKSPIGKRFDEKITPIKTNVRKDFITNKTSSANITIGFSGQSSNDVKSTIISELVSQYINMTDFGMSDELQKLNAVRYFGTEKISTNPNNPVFKYIQIECAEENAEKALKMIFDKFSQFKLPDEKTLNNIKESMIMDFEDSLEYSDNVNYMVGISEFSKNIDYIAKYKDIVNSITLRDVENYVNQFLDINKAAITVVHPETSEAEINQNYINAQNLSFKGSKISFKGSREPVNMNKVSEDVLNNNYKIAFSESANNNVPFFINMYYNLPADINPAVVCVLDAVYSKGIKNSTEKEFLKMQEENNIIMDTSVDKSSFYAGGYSSADKFQFTVDKVIELINNPNITEENVDMEIKKLKDKLSRHDNDSFDLYENYESKNNPEYNSIPELIEGLNKVTVEDVQNLHNYIMKNSTGTIVINLPEKESKIKNQALAAFSQLNNVKPYKYELRKIYSPNEKPVVLKESRDTSQADISQIYKFKTDNSIKDNVTAKLMNTILSSSDTIGLFNSLRERDHLAYRVNSSIDTSGDCKEIRLHILTSTDNKDTGITTYDNVEKSIIGFNRQINSLLNSEYKDSDLESAKRILKAELLDNESVYSRLYSINKAEYRDEKLDYQNRVFEMIDSITREDIDKMSKRAFENPPVYSIVASGDTLNNNQAFLSKLAE